MRHSLFNCAKLSPDGSDLYGPGARVKRARLQLVLSTAIAGLDLVALAQKPAQHVDSNNGFGQDGQFKTRAKQVSLTETPSSVRTGISCDPTRHPRFKRNVADAFLASSTCIAVRIACGFEGAVARHTPRRACRQLARARASACDCLRCGEKLPASPTVSRRMQFSTRLPQ